MNSNSDTQDNVETTATENTGDERQEHEEQPGIESQESEQPEPEQTEQESTDKEKAEQEGDKKRNRAQERIQQLARERAELKRELDEIKAKQSQPETSEAPRIEDFEDYSEYLKAQQDYFVKEAENRVMQKLKQEQEQKTQVEKQVEFETAVTELRESGIDVDGLVKKAEEMPPLPVTLDQFGLSAKETLSLAADLLQNEDLYFELSQMNPYQAAMKIGQIIGTKQPTKVAPKTPNAPKPIKPTSANAPVKRSEDSMSDEEFLAKRRAERLKG